MRWHEGGGMFPGAILSHLWQTQKYKSAFTVREKTVVVLGLQNDLLMSIFFKTLVTQKNQN